MVAVPFSADDWHAGRAPYFAYASAIVRSGNAQCSAFIVAARGEWYYATCARHCFGGTPGHRVTLTYWVSREGGENQAGVAGPVRAETAAGEIIGGLAGKDAVLVRFRGRPPVMVGAVGRIDGGHLVGREAITVGHGGGAWPATIFRGPITSKSGSTVWGRIEIKGGQSGGALIDAQTGLLIGITNWGTPNGLAGAEGPETINALLDRFLPKDAD